MCDYVLFHSACFYYISATFFTCKCEVKTTRYKRNTYKYRLIFFEKNANYELCNRTPHTLQILDYRWL